MYTFLCLILPKVTKNFQASPRYTEKRILDGDIISYINIHNAVPTNPTNKVILHNEFIRNRQVPLVFLLPILTNSTPQFKFTTCAA